MIRIAVIADIDRIVELGQRFRICTKYAGFIAASADAMEELAYNLITGNDSAVFLADLDGLTVGMLGLVTFKHPISGETFGSELFWWVEPEYRGHGIRLLYAAERWARSRGARAFQMIAPTSDVAAIYSRLGYTEVETLYQKRLNEVRAKGT